MDFATLLPHTASRMALWSCAAGMFALAALPGIGDARAAAPAPVWQDMPSLVAIARDHVTQAISDPGGRLLVSVVPPDERLRLPACAAPVAETPEGQRLWGWTQVRIRCPGQGGWSLSVRTRVQIMAPALTTRRALQAGQVIDIDDIQRGEVDITSHSRPVLREESQVLGRVVRLGLAAGQPIGAEHVKLPIVVRRGTPLEVSATVGQVSVISTGTALQDGAVGEVIRVRMTGGRTVQGVVTGDGRAAVQMQ